MTVATPTLDERPVGAAPAYPARARVGSATRYLPSAAYAVAASAAVLLLDRWITAPNLSLVFVLPVVIAALRHGFGPALSAAVLGVVAYNYLLIEPRYTFDVTDTDYVWALALLLIVAAAVSAVAAQARRGSIEARENAARADALQDLARTLTVAETREAVTQAGRQALSRIFGKPAVVLLSENGALEPSAVGPDVSLSVLDEEAARWALATGRASRAGFSPIEEAKFDFWPFKAEGGRAVVLGLALADAQQGRPASPERAVEAVADHIWAGLERQALAARMLDVRMAAESQRLKSDLLAAVSHDLRTPLSTIQLTLETLRRFDRVHEPAVRDALLAGAEAETARLRGLVGNLLDMSRLSAEAVAAELRPTRLAAVVLDALKQADRALKGRDILDGTANDALSVLADPALARTALANVLENAAKYAPDGPIELRASKGQGYVRLDVLDRGHGFPPDAEAMFERFTRGVSGDGRPPGTGLGLAVARGFMAAQGGAAEASPRFDGPGARVRLLFREAVGV